MEKLIIAGNNAGKIKEFKTLLSGKFDVLSLSEAGITLDVEETGKTFLENAELKARALSKLVDCSVLSDDSGLAVKALDGAPGVYSARYAGEKADSSQNIDLLLKNMTGATDRSAMFVCVVALIRGGRIAFGHGQVNGRILHERQGTNGFGYDPIFYSYELNKTFAQATDEEKNAVSHRRRALINLFGEP